MGRGAFTGNSWSPVILEGVTADRSWRAYGSLREHRGGLSSVDSTADSDSDVALLVESLAVSDRDGFLNSEEWQLARRVAESPLLGKSELLPKFLLYVCEQHLLGRDAEISEQRVGIQVFNRPENYNPGEDNIVRSYARLLRKRLDAYFENEGAEESMRILIPRGGYVPSFETRPDPQPADAQLPANPISDATQDAIEDQNPPKNLVKKPFDLLSASRGVVADMAPLRKQAWLLVVLGLLAGCLLTATISLGWNAFRSMKARGPAHALWDQIFQRDRKSLIVVTDSSVGILQNLTRSHASIEDYANGSYISAIQAPAGLDAPNFNDLRRQLYTSVVSVNIANALSRLPEFIPDRTEIRFAREIGLEDVKRSNVILIGSKHTDPWVSLFEGKLNFRLEYSPQVDDSYVVNVHPLRAEQEIYRNDTDSSFKRTYGAIAFVPSLDGAGHVLIIQGLNMAATQAAADVLFKPATIAPVLKQARSRNGELRPFELLVETMSVGATAPDVKVIATHISPGE